MAGTRGCAGGDLVCGQGRFFKKVFNLSKLTLLVIMSKQVVSGLKEEEKKPYGLTPEQRKHLERSLRENDELMRCLAEM
jgi:hypothetical protein